MTFLISLQGVHTFSQFEKMRTLNSIIVYICEIVEMAEKTHHDPRNRYDSGKFVVYVPIKFV